MSRVSEGPLTGVRIIEVGHMLAGPYCGMLLADLGAEVIKVEPPSGDISRHVGPHRVGPHNTYFASLNRNKRGMVLDLSDTQDRASFDELVRGAQGLVTNLRPAAIKKLGLTYEALAKLNPKIACLALTGYGLDGPFSDRPAYDYVIQALVGIMALTGDPDGPPVKAGYSAVDNSSGIMGALALVAMIHGGKGGQLDVSLYDVMLSQLNYLASAYLNAQDLPKRHPNGAHPYIVPAQIFETADGHVALFVSHDEFWARLARELDEPRWVTDEHFATMTARAANRELVLGEVAAVLLRETTSSWVERLAPLGIVIAGVETLEQALHSALVAARGMVISIPVGEEELKLVASPIKIAGWMPTYEPPPLLGDGDPQPRLAGAALVAARRGG